MLRRPTNAKSENLSILNENKNFKKEFLSALKSIFKMFDIHLKNELSYKEFSDFFDAIQKKLTEKDFQDLKSKVHSTHKGITFRGFCEYFREVLDEEGKVF